MKLPPVSNIVEKYNAWIGVFGLAVGVLGTLASVWIYSLTRDDALLVFTRNYRDVYIAPKHFELPATNGVVKLDSPVVEHTWVLVNEGPGSVRESDIREPVRFQIIPPGKLLDAKVLQQKRAIKDNVSLTQTKDADGEWLEMQFKVLDPGDSITLVFLSAGGDGGFSFNQHFGPKVRFRQYDAKFNLIVTLAGIGAGIGLVFAALSIFVDRQFAKAVSAKSSHQTLRKYIRISLQFALLIASCVLALYAIRIALDYVENGMPFPK